MAHGLEAEVTLGLASSLWVNGESSRDVLW
jgi:hypothetical protein